MEKSGDGIALIAAAGKKKNKSGNKGSEVGEQ